MPGTEFRLRRAAEHDIPELLTLADRILHMHAVPEPEIFRYPVDPNALSAMLAEVLASTAHEIWLADAPAPGPAAVGYLWYEIQHKHTKSLIMKERRAIFVHHLLVDPDWARRGLGRRFIALLQEARTFHGCRTIELETLSENHPAVAFYRAMGFRETVKKFSLP